MREGGLWSIKEKMEFCLNAFILRKGGFDGHRASECIIRLLEKAKWHIGQYKLFTRNPKKHSNAVQHLQEAEFVRCEISKLICQSAKSFP